ncbi:MULTISPECIES: aspartate aminotransferase family protein [Photobacterium]|uniref:Omega amino acid--pyruvate aminotransferase n=2 Tax=Photobacterium ganghwense TaxID=320778 RepID=A0A0J1K6R9_9GAMM|nr:MULTISPECIES: aspartate aminotransferase family protein [Photobacterium]KLV10042.1 omega amino acid--pyruvate aminotransferase [Photobacterium ganghwense]PSU09100.1 aspartate aminotransferase family protein [Photobacterium ganghwense]QSV16296.1 aspartate aminotransferase family protein [Photobacterium ganghwense]
MKKKVSYDAFWMPFTANRDFKANPRIINRAEGMYCYSDNGTQLLDATAGLWCVNAGHARQEIGEAMARQVAELDYSSPFNFGHDIGFEFAERLVEFTPTGLNKVFFTNSGSEAVESALKIALAYQRAKGNTTKFKLIGRELAYHGVNFGGLSVGGLTPNRTGFGPLLPADHLSHTLDVERNAFSKGLPEHGVEKAEQLEQLIQFHGAESVAAVIVEPISGAGGVILPPKGYLKRLREICDRHDVVLIFDEVITGWGRLGSPFAAQEFEVTPDLITSAKGITSGVVPLGAVFAKDEIYETVVNSAAEGSVEFYHGYTYSGHPVACAAGLATMDIYQREGLLERGRGEIGQYFADGLHSLKGIQSIVDIRNYGLIGAVQFAAPADGKPIGFDILKRCYDKGLLVRSMGNTIALSPPLIIEKSHVDQIIDTLAAVAKDIPAK